MSNHPDLRDPGSGTAIPFHQIPVAPETKPAAETEQLVSMTRPRGRPIALARYMQILSPTCAPTCRAAIINIHHSLLPSFKGARPYEQAHRRGVKVIGATAHYVTADLDEGPIIEQDFRRVDHRSSGELAAMGQDLEAWPSPEPCAPTPSTGCCCGTPHGRLRLTLTTHLPCTASSGGREQDQDVAVEVLEHGHHPVSLVPRLLVEPHAG